MREIFGLEGIATIAFLLLIMKLLTLMCHLCPPALFAQLGPLQDVSGNLSKKKTTGQHLIWEPPRKMHIPNRDRHTFSQSHQ